MDIASPEHKANPFPFYARLRAESPVHRVILPHKVPAWLVTRYDDVAQVLKDGRFAKSNSAAKQPWVPGFVRPLTRNMLDLDEPDHTRLRALVSKAFTPSRVERMRPRIESLTTDLLDRARQQRQIDLIRDYALPLPTTIIAEMLGVPRADQHKFNRWSRAIVSSNPTGWQMLRALPPIWLFLRFIRRLVRLKRERPADDLLSALVQAEEEGQHLSEDELVAMVFLLLVAGHETTVNLIGNGVLALVENPEQLERLRADRDLLESCVEELLRFGSPLETATERYAREDVRIAGTTIPRGSLVFAAIASANRDERQFVDSDRLDIAREPNKHLSFGLGPHYCLGAPLARLEGQIAIDALLRHTTRLAVSSTPLRWRPGLVLRGLEALPLEVKWV
jgi:cytochrome P450 PksS